jgi:hypothetical protein
MSKFANVAIKCDTFEQIEHLAELARKEGLDVRNIIAAGCWYFRYDESFGYYSNWTLDNDMPTISYAEFIAEYSPQPTYTHDEYMRNVVHSMD